MGLHLINEKTNPCCEEKISEKKNGRTEWTHERHACMFSTMVVRKRKGKGRLTIADFGGPSLK